MTGSRYNRLVRFEWDERKAKTNLKKHDVAFAEATEVFGDPFAITFSDPQHSLGELRFITFGLTRTRKLLVIAHAEREESIRIISARPATRTERKIYEED
jgi:uncharacterized protein